MMKRTKFILLALVAAMVLMGAGYAAWTQAFNISATVTTGKLHVEVEHVGTVVEVTDSEGDYVDAASVNPNYLSNLNNVVATEQKDGTLASISYSLGKMYPGTRIKSTFRFENTGTIGVIGKVSLESFSGHALFNAMNIIVGYYDNETYKELPATGDNGSEKMESLIANIESQLASLDTGKEVELVIIQELPYSDKNSEDMQTSWELEVVFEQYNYNPQAN